MKCSCHWKPILVSLLLSSAVLGAKWHTLRSQHAIGGNLPASALGGTSSRPSVPVKTLSGEDAQVLLEKIWKRFSTFTINGQPKPEEVPVYIALPFLENLTIADLIFLLGQAEQEHEGLRRDTLRRIFFEACSTEAPETALNAAAQWPPGLTDKLMAPVLEAWQSQNGDAARWFQRLTAEHPGKWSEGRRAVGLENGEIGTPKVSGKIEPVPPTLAEAWAETSWRNDELEPTNWTDHALAPIAVWAASSGRWEEALAQLEKLPTDHKKRSARYSLQRDWAEHDWRGWLAWERAHPERRAPDFPYGFTSALGGALYKMQEYLRPEEPTDPAELSAFMDEYMISVENLATNNLARQEGMSLLEKWGNLDPEHASAWLNRQKPGALRDLAAETLAKSTIGEEPQSALAWAASIADPDRREAALVDSWKAWRKLEPAPADAWVDAHYPDIRTSAARVEAKRAVTSP